MAESWERRDVEALAAARAELGADYEAALLESFADRVEAAVEQRIAAVTHSVRGERGVDRRLAGQQLALGIISLIAAIPISIVCAVQGELTIMLIAWAGIVAVNWAHAAQGRRRVPWYADPRVIRPDR